MGSLLTLTIVFVLTLAMSDLMGAVRAEVPAGTLEIRLASGTALEQRGRVQLERLLATHDLSRWLFTRTVQIQSRVIPHSHPVLTLNTQSKYVQNIVDAALSSGVRKFILISFPHVEGETSPGAPALGELDAHSTTLHSQTRLAAEQYLFRVCEGKSMKPLVLRAGVIYGRGVKLIEAARSLMRRRLLAIWCTPTWVHLLALPDFLRVVKIGIEKEELSGIFNICDDKPMLLQDFLDEIATHWGFKAPLRLPAFVFYWTAVLCEAFATIFHTRTPLTRDIVTMGMTSVVADTSRMKNEISATLLFPTLKQGLAII